MVSAPPVRFAYPDTSTASFAWDTVFKGAMKSSTTPMGVDEVSKNEYLAYDAMGRVTSSRQTTSGKTFNFGYTYNKAGMVASQTYPSGRVISNCYNAGGQEKSVSGLMSGVPHTYAASAAYGSHGALTGVAVGPSYQVSLAYNQHHRQRTSTQVTYGGGLRFQSNLYYCASGQANCTDNNGNILRQETHDGAVQRTQNYSYDALNRLSLAVENSIGVGHTGFSQGYNYDRYGNQWLTAGSTLTGGMFHATQQSEYGATTNRLENLSTYDLKYDAAGNLWNEHDVIASFDGEERMVRSVPGWVSGTTGYLYDAEGRRIKKENLAFGRTLYVYDAFGRLAAEYPDTAVSACTTCYLFADHLGSTRMVGDYGGTVVKRYDFFPFGSEIVSNQPWANGRGALHGTESPVRQQFTGWQRSEGYEWHSYYAGARYYRTGLARFTGADAPLVDQHAGDPQSWNLYAYVRNNPLRFVDPNGMKCVDLNTGGKGDDGLPGDACPPEAGINSSHGVVVHEDGRVSEPMIFYVTLGPLPFAGSGRIEPEDPRALRGMFSNPFRTGTGTLLNVVKRPRIDVKKPKLETHPNRDPSTGNHNRRKTPQPADAVEVYKTAIPDPTHPETRWWGKSATGDIYRYHGANGRVHFSGSESSGLVVPNEVKVWLQ